MHQLDFKVTVNCGSFEALHKIEQMLTLKGAGALFLGQPLFNIVDRSYHGELNGFEVDIHSVDINEDTTDEAVYVCWNCSQKLDIHVVVDPQHRLHGVCIYCGDEVAVYPVIEESKLCVDCGIHKGFCGCGSDGESGTVREVCHTCNCNRPCECDYEDYVAANIEASIIGAHDQAELPEQVTFIKCPTTRWIALSDVAPGMLFETQRDIRYVKTAPPWTQGKIGCIEVGSGRYKLLHTHKLVKVLICEEDDIPF